MIILLLFHKWKNYESNVQRRCNINNLPQEKKINYRWQSSGWQRRRWFLCVVRFGCFSSQWGHSRAVSNTPSLLLRAFTTSLWLEVLRCRTASWGVVKFIEQKEQKYGAGCTSAVTSPFSLSLATWLVSWWRWSATKDRRTWEHILHLIRCWYTSDAVSLTVWPVSLACNRSWKLYRNCRSQLQQDNVRWRLIITGTEPFIIDTTSRWLVLRRWDSIVALSAHQKLHGVHRQLPPIWERERKRKNDKESLCATEHPGVRVN